MAEVADDA